MPMAEVNDSNSTKQVSLVYGPNVYNPLTWLIFQYIFIGSCFEDPGS